MAVHDKCGFGESDQESVVKTLPDFAFYVYNNLSCEDEQIDVKTAELFMCEFVIQFSVSLQKLAEGMSFAKASVAGRDDFVRYCQVAGC